MTHDEIRERLPLYLTGDLDPESEMVLVGHLEDCESCAEELAALARTAARIETLPRRAAVPTRSAPRRIPALLRAAVLVLAFLLGMGAQALRREAPPPRAGSADRVATPAPNAVDEETRTERARAWRELAPEPNGLTRALLIGRHLR